MIADSTDFVFCTDDSIQQDALFVLTHFIWGALFRLKPTKATRGVQRDTWRTTCNTTLPTRPRGVLPKRASKHWPWLQQRCVKATRGRTERPEGRGKPTRNGRMHKGSCAENADRGKAETPMRKQNSLKPTLGWCLHQNPCEAVGLLQSRILAHHHLRPPRDSTIGSTVPISARRHSPTTFGQPLQWQRAPHAPSDAHTMA